MNIGNKRKDATQGGNGPKRVKKECEYGEKCYRKNPAHFREFSHRHLESILDEYSGSGDYPIPEKYSITRQSIMEQLDVIVEKELYTARKADDVHGSSSSSSQQLLAPRSSIQHTLMQNVGVERSSASPANKDSDSQNAGLSSRNAEVSSINTAMSSRNADLSSINAETSSRNAEVSSRNTEGININADSVANKARATNSNYNNTISKLDYKKAADYRPVVHPTRPVEEFLNVVLPKGQMAAKHAASSPYHIFYTTITSSEKTHAQPYSITFLEILDPSLGELKCSLQINFMVELGWLLAQYYFAGYSEKKLTILYGEDSADLRTITQKKPHVDAHKVAMSNPFGTHHTKMMILCYEDGSLRVVISTANLYVDDWENRTQGLWFSPCCPELPPDSGPHDGESPTQFKRCLLRYLAHYQLASLAGYVERVKRADFSHINVFLVASVPGSHPDTEWGMTRVGSLLRQHCRVPAAETSRWPLLAQASSIGSFGQHPALWLTGHFLNNFSQIKDQTQMLPTQPELKLIYPSLENVKQSHDGLLDGGCLPYGAAVHFKQPWLNDFLYQWRATSTCRNSAMPHIKSYTRTSPDNKMAAFYLLTSANVSKAAWGSVNKGDAKLRLMSYEAGVLLLPAFVIKKDYFPLDGATDRLVLAYDVPPTKYTDDISPWVMDYLS